MATRKGGSFGWFLIGILVGAIAVAGAYIYVTREETEVPAAAAEPALPLAPDAPANAPPVVAAPAPAIAPGPNTAAPDGGDREPSEEERQIADDAAATGMTGPVNPPVDQPTN